jgi:hypothetical protein
MKARRRRRRRRKVILMVVPTARRQHPLKSHVVRRLNALRALLKRGAASMIAPPRTT